MYLNLLFLKHKARNKKDVDADVDESLLSRRSSRGLHPTSAGFDGNSNYSSA